MMIQRREAGLSLIELVVALVIVAILLSAAAPNFEQTVKNARIDSWHTSLIGVLNMSRSEAIKSSNGITVCARYTATSCGSDWSGGWLAFRDDATVGTIGTVDTGEEILANVQLEDGLLSISTSGLVPPAALAARPFIHYRARGEGDWSMGTFVLCDSRGAESADAIVVTISGVVRAARRNSMGIPLDVQNTAVTCP